MKLNTFHQATRNRCLQACATVALAISTANLVACDTQEDTSQTTLRSDQADALDQTSMAHSCASQFEGWDSAQSEEELNSCSERARNDSDRDHSDSDKRPKPKKWFRPLIKRAIKACRPDFRECIEQGGDKATCKEELRSCIKEYIHDQFDEMCERLLDRCDQANPRPKVCDRIEKKCEEILD